MKSTIFSAIPPSPPSSRGGDSNKSGSMEQPGSARSVKMSTNTSFARHGKSDLDKLPKEMNGMKILEDKADEKDFESTLVNGNGTETVYRMSRHYVRMNQHMPMLYVQLYTYQICRSLNYIHNVIGVCHRDIKPQNLLVNPQTHQLKLCDFGSAKMLVPGEPNISYICSRYYRAPELIFGATEYTNYPKH
ncbi:hypothetical protein LXL04_005106 [Taraxacum kok-saghyz]